MLKLLSKSNFLVNVILAVIMTAVVFAIVYFTVDHTNYIYLLFFERSLIQYLTVFFFWLSIISLFSMRLMITIEKKAFESTQQIIKALPEQYQTGTLVWTDVPKVRGDIEEKLEGHTTDSRIIRRIKNGLERLSKTQSTSETREYFNTASESDYSKSESGFAMINYFTWLLPTLGFIGTVMGIGAGIAGFAAIISNASDFESIKEALPTVTATLGTAFDTTLLALLLSVLVVWYSSATRKKDDELLNDTDMLCHDGILPLFREYSHATKEFIEEMEKGTDRVVESNTSSRIVLENHLRNLTAETQESNKQLIKLQGDVQKLEQEVGEIKKQNILQLATFQGLQEGINNMAKGLNALASEIKGLGARNASKPASGPNVSNLDTEN